MQYIETLKSSWASRTAPQDSKLTKLVICAVLLVLAYIIFAILMHPEDETADYHFYSERGLITAMSATLLAFAAAFALAVLAVHRRAGDYNIWPWLLMALGFIFLSLDETAQFHERLGDVIHEQFDSGVFRNWNDVIVILYGVFALPVVIAVMPTILRYRPTFEFFVAAFVFYALHTLIDSTQEPSTIISIILEESCKLYCGLFLTLSMYVSLLGALPNSPAPDDNTSR